AISRSRRSNINTQDFRLVMPALVAGIHVLLRRPRKTWMAGTSPAMTWRARRFRARACQCHCGGHAFGARCDARRTSSQREDELMLSRRNFLTSTIAAGATLATQGAQKAAAQVDRRMIVDAQIHLWKAESEDWKWVPGLQPQLP